MIQLFFTLLNSNAISMRIPRIIHQTWKTKQLPTQLAEWSASWKALNPNWEHRLYDDADCEQVIASARPDLLDLYRGLERPVERADVFRYVVLWRDGGIYTDMDTVCEKPLDEWLRADDELVVGIEAEPKAQGLGYVWPRQYCQWTIAARPKHPTLERCIEYVHDRVNNASLYDDEWRRAGSRTLSARDWKTIMMTGPGPWTSAVNAGQTNNEVMRILPECAFGMRADNARLCYPEALVTHQFLGSWKDRPAQWPLYTIPALLVFAFLWIVMCIVGGVLLGRTKKH